MFECKLFALCPNGTDQGVNHPVLGLTPCCTRCAENMKMTDRLIPLPTE